MTTGLGQRLLVLMARERLTRFAGGRLGPAWAFLTPIAWIAFVVILFKALGRLPSIHVKPEIFVATGVLPYIAFRQAVTSMSRAIPAHRYMQVLRPVSINDILLSTALLEAMHMIFSAALIFGAISFIFGASLPDNLPLVLLGLALAWLLAATLGRLVAILGAMSDSFARSVPILLRPLFWISGVFYTASELPTALSETTSPIATIWLPIGVSCGLFLLSVIAEEWMRSNRHLRFQI